MPEWKRNPCCQQRWNSHLVVQIPFLDCSCVSCSPMPCLCDSVPSPAPQPRPRPAGREPPHSNEARVVHLRTGFYLLRNVVHLVMATKLSIELVLLQNKITCKVCFPNLQQASQSMWSGYIFVSLKVMKGTKCLWHFFILFSIFCGKRQTASSSPS